MVQTQDIFLRALAVAPDKKKRKGTYRPSTPADDDSKWSKVALVFDTESRITADQSLTFGVYRLCELVNDNYSLVEEGIFYASDLPPKERTVLKNYVRTAVSDVASFPPRFPLYSRSDFMRRVFWPAIRDGALICGFNLPFDLSRLALGWNRGENDEWSLIMSQYPDGNDNRNYPRILITPIDSKKAFIKLAKPWKPKKWKYSNKAHFIDLRTLAWALFNQSFSLKRACEQLKTKHQKLEHEPTGNVTADEIGYARQDVRCTVDVLNVLRQGSLYSGDYWTATACTYRCRGSSLRGQGNGS